MSRIFSFCIFFILIASCRTISQSELRKGVIAGPGGRAILFKNDGDIVVIKVCVDHPADFNGRKDCDKKPGTIEGRPSVKEFRDHIKMVLKHSSKSFSKERKRQIDLYNKGSYGFDGYRSWSEEQKNTQLKSIDNVRQFAEMIKKDSLNPGLDSLDKKKIATIENNLAETESEIKKSDLQSSHIDKVNALIDELIDDIILDSKKFEVFLADHKDEKYRFFFDILNTYVTNPTLQWKFVQLSKVSGQRLPYKFRMGSNRNENEQHVHRVELTSDIAVKETEVTQLEWFQIMGYSPSKHSDWQYCRKGEVDDKSAYIEEVDICPDHPVERVSWRSVQRFIGKVNALNGLKCGDTSKPGGFDTASSTPGCYRLPTEAEWEYFARSGTDTPFNVPRLNGGRFISTNHANYSGSHSFKGGYSQGSYRGRTVTVANFPAAKSPWGLYDIHGNVAEWVQDGYQDSYSEGFVRNPKGPIGMDTRAIRGGGYRDHAEQCTATSRQGVSESLEKDHIGFRLVRTVGPRKK